MASRLQRWQTHAGKWQTRLTMLAATSIVMFSAQAQVVRFEVLSTSPAFEGRSFGAVGPYVKIRAKATIAIDPADPRNAVIADIAAAPRNAAGRVEAVADVEILRPADLSRGNATLLVDIPNRGRKLAPQLFDDAAQPGANNAERAGDAGLGHTHEQGYTQVWIGWQSDIPSQPAQLALAGPALHGVVGASRDEILFDHLRSPATATLAWPLADPASLKVTVRPHWAAPRQQPQGLSIRAIGLQTVEITRPAAGFDAAALYEVTYQARDPLVLGLAFAAVRDVASFLRREGGAGNPLAVTGRSSVQRAIGFGVSQSGRYLRDFLYLGFNEDTQGAQVFDGLMPHIAGARRMSLNQRFAQPGRNARHPQDPAWQADLFPFAYQVMSDSLTGRRDGLLARCNASNTCPKVMQTDSEHEWWASRGSLLVTDTQGRHAEPPPNVRVYMIAGTPHFSEAADLPRQAPTMANSVNPMHAGPPMRALLAGMQAWITGAGEPPASRVPMRAHGTLVHAAQALPVALPALGYSAIFTGASLTDPTAFPPKELGRYPVFVPLADADGMAISGIRMLPLAVPRATYTGWNPRPEGYGKGTLFPLQGSVWPLAATKAEREAKGDPRPALAERYASEEAYVQAVQAAAEQMLGEGLLLPADARRAVQAAREGKLARLK